MQFWARRQHADGRAVGELQCRQPAEWSRHDQGGRRRIDQRISAWLPSARSSRRDGQAAQRAAAGTGELLWARTQLSHTGPVPTGPRGRARQHRVAGAGWRDARGQHQPGPVARVQSALYDSPSSGHQAQRHRSRRHARAAENVWQPCRASGCRSDPCLAPRSRALRCICILLAGAPPAVHLTAPPRDTAGAFSTHPRCLSTPYMRILAISGRLRRFWRGDPLTWAGGPFCHSVHYLITLLYYSYAYKRYVWL